MESALAMSSDGEMNAVDQLAKMLMEKMSESVDKAIAKPIEELKDDQKDLGNRVEKLEIRTTLEYDEQRQIQLEVNYKVHELLTNETHENWKKYSRIFYCRLYSALKDRYGVPSYRAIRRKDFEEAKEFIRNWDPIGGVQALKHEVDYGSDDD